MKSIAIMQPYVFPYLGYFQLIQEVDSFIFYDDVNFITRGWINRNKILSNGKEYLFTIPCKQASQNKLIYEVQVDWNNRAIQKLLKTIKYSYASAPYFEDVYALIEDLFSDQPENISTLAGDSIQRCCNYLGIEQEFKYSSGQPYNNSDIENKADRLIDITKQEEAKHYINPIGAKNLYEKDTFKKKGIRLSFQQPCLDQYNQDTDSFVEGLSFIDVMMYVPPNEVCEMMEKGKLV